MPEVLDADRHDREEDDGHDDQGEVLPDGGDFPEQIAAGDEDHHPADVEGADGGEGPAAKRSESTGRKIKIALWQENRR